MEVEPPLNAASAPRDWTALAATVVAWGRDLGFEDVGITDTDLSAEEPKYARWLAAGRHGTMDYMARHGTARSRSSARAGRCSPSEGERATDGARSTRTGSRTRRCAG